jgi:hypothetical protein
MTHRAWPLFLPKQFNLHAHASTVYISAQNELLSRQDNAPPHYSLRMRERLQEIFLGPSITCMDRISPLRLRTERPYHNSGG